MKLLLTQRAPRARVGEDSSSLLDCAGPCRGSLPLKRRVGRVREGRKPSLLDCTGAHRENRGRKYKEKSLPIRLISCLAGNYAGIRSEQMKKGQELTGIVERVDFPNKGIVRTEEGQCVVKMCFRGRRSHLSFKKREMEGQKDG